MVTASSDDTIRLIYIPVSYPRSRSTTSTRHDQTPPGAAHPERGRPGPRRSGSPAARIPAARSASSRIHSLTSFALQRLARPNLTGFGICPATSMFSSFLRESPIRLPTSSRSMYSSNTSDDICLHSIIRWCDPLSLFCARREASAAVVRIGGVRQFGNSKRQWSASNLATPARQRGCIVAH